MDSPLLQLDNVSMRFSLGHHRVTDALKGVSLSLEKGETLGLVGESGCGKSTLARVVMGIYRPTSGTVFFKGEALEVRRHAQRLKHARRAQMIFQDPYSSLDPRMTVQDIVAESLDIHERLTKQQRYEMVCALLEMVGLPAASVRRFPHEFSGGQRQRIGIARALAVSPELLVCDEPTSALDVSVQSQIINLLTTLRKEQGLSYLFISHNLTVVRSLADRIVVMYKGAVVECAAADELYRNPLHPYTKVLLGAILEVDHPQILSSLPATLDEIAPPATSCGCSFAHQCPRAKESCLVDAPSMVEVGKGHCVACSFIANL